MKRLITFLSPTTPASELVSIFEGRFKTTITNLKAKLDMGESEKDVN